MKNMNIIFVMIWLKIKFYNFYIFFKCFDDWNVVVMVGDLVVSQV